MPVLLPIETTRLLVRPFVVDLDCEAMLDVYGDPEVMRLIPGGALADVDAVRALLDAYASAQHARGFSSWALVERESASVIGDVGFGTFAPTGDVELGYTLARRYWHRGYATEAAGACLGAGLAQLSVERIIAVVDEANEASARVAERIGMRDVQKINAHGRPHIVFAAERATWRGPELASLPPSRKGRGGVRTMSSDERPRSASSSQRSSVRSPDG